MNRVTVTRYKCEHCGKLLAKRPGMERHEAHCYRNPDRVPWPGEISNLLPLASCRTDVYWHDGRPIIEDRCEERDAHPWWPGAGKLYTGSHWIDVPGYTTDGSREQWPDDVDKMDPWQRLMWARRNGLIKGEPSS